MSSSLPEYIDPLLFAEKGRSLEGKFPLSSLPRLDGMLADYDGMVRFNLEFQRRGRDSIIAGRVEAKLVLECQVCLETIELPIDRSVSLAVVTSIDEAQRLPDEFEALLLDSEEAVALKNIVEDEILLALPDIAKHPGCHLDKKDETVEVEVESVTRENPFSVLKDLKNTD